MRVRECEIPALLRPRVYIDLVNLGEHAARTALLDGVRPERGAPHAKPDFPGEPVGPKPKRFPGALPEIWEVPHSRNPNFTGRDQMLRDLHVALRSGSAAALTQAVAGLGGVGKTQLALEYCYRFGSEYDLVWWMRAEEPATLASDYARLASRLGLREKDLPNQREIIAAVRDWLTHETEWLLVFDNATAPDACKDYLPRSTSGHILITSRHQAWRGMAHRMPVLQFSREESIAFLERRSGRNERENAHFLCQLLGDLPIALEHAAAYIDETGMSILEYTELYREASRELLEPVAATWRLSFEKLRSEQPGAIDFLNLIAYLAPDKVPRDLLKSATENPLAFAESIKALLRYSLIDAGADTISVHRLVQQVTRDALEASEQRRWAEAAVNVINDAFPSPLDHRNWPACGRLLAHAIEAASYADELSLNTPVLATLLNDVGLYERYRGQLAGSELRLRRALDIAERVYGPEHSEVAIRANNLALTLYDEGDLEGALQYARRALDIDERVHGPDHPKVGIRANNIGLILKDKRDLDGALQYARRALDIEEKVDRPDHPKIAIRANNLGLILKDKGDLDGALQYAHRALEIGERVHGPDHPSVAIRLNNIGSILKDKGDLEGALQHIRRALTIFEKTYGPDNPSTRTVAENLRAIENAIAASNRTAE